MLLPSYYHTLEEQSICQSSGGRGRGWEKHKVRWNRSYRVATGFRRYVVLSFRYSEGGHREEFDENKCREAIRNPPTCVCCMPRWSWNLNCPIIVYANNYHSVSVRFWSGFCNFYSTSFPRKWKFPREKLVFVLIFFTWDRKHHRVLSNSPAMT